MQWFVSVRISAISRVHPQKGRLVRNAIHRIALGRIGLSYLISFALFQCPGSSCSFGRLAITHSCLSTFIPECADTTAPAKQRFEIHFCNSRLHVPHRSEERRVGKECRSRWSP